VKTFLRSCLGLLVIVIDGCQTTAVPKVSTAAIRGALQSGDLVFQDSSPHSGQAAQIKALTRSHWSHCGIYFTQPDGPPVVIDGNGTGPVVTWETWRSGGAGGEYAAYRLRSGLSDAQVRQLRKAADHYDRRPYDLKFAWDDGAIYCSELVWKAYHDALGLEIGRRQKLSDFDLDSPLARPLIVRNGGWGSVKDAQTHGNEPVVSPQAITESSLLERVR
jgi:hypothetical protein